MKLSPSATFLMLLVTAQAGPVIRLRDDDALEYRSLADILGTLTTLKVNNEDQAATTVASAEAPQAGEAGGAEDKAAAQGAEGKQQASEKQANTEGQAAEDAKAAEKATAPAAEDPATALQGAADALKQATAAVDQAITGLGASANTGEAANANNTANGAAEAAGNEGAAKAAENGAAKATEKGAAKATEKGAAKATEKGAAKGSANNATANVSSPAATEGGATAAALTKAAGGAVVAKTAEGLLLPDGRIGQNVVATDFNVVTSVFKSAVVKADGLVFSDIVTFPGTTPSIFDVAGNTKAFEISINDTSIFTPQGGEPQTEFRRADLLPSIISTAENSSTTGKRTMHFSVQQDPAKPLALATNEYQLSFLETADFASRTFDVRVGTGTTGPSLDGQNIVVFGRSGADIKEMFVAPFSADLQNFAVTLDFDKNTMQVFHSTGATPLAQVSEEVTNDNTGDGEYHFALLKLADAQGQQAAGIDEGIIYSGIFMEDSSDGTVTLQ